MSATVNSEHTGADGKTKAVPGGFARDRVHVYPAFYQRPEELSDEYREYLIKVLTVQLSSEYQDRSRRPIAPSAEWIEDVGIQLRGETEHGLGLVDLLRSLGVDPMPYVEKAQNASPDARLLDVFRKIIRFQVEGTATSEELWISVGIGRWLVERGGGYQSLGAIGSNYLPWASWSARNFKDEGFEHSNSGKLIAKAAIARGHERTVQLMFAEIWPYAVDMFGQNDSSNIRKFLELGIKTVGNREVRLAWLAHIKAEAEELGVELPRDPLKGHRGDYSN